MLCSPDMMGSGSKPLPDQVQEPLRVAVLLPLRRHSCGSLPANLADTKSRCGPEVPTVVPSRCRPSRWMLTGSPGTT